MHVHMHAPQPDLVKMETHQCPECKQTCDALFWHVPWYGWTVTCLGCGDEWQDGERSERPFAPKWRQRRIADARRRWEQHGAIPTSALETV